MTPSSPAPLHLNNSTDALLHAVSTDCTEMQRLVHQIAQYRSAGGIAEELLAESVEDFLSSPVRQRLRSRLAKMECWARGIQAHARTRLRRVARRD